MHNNFFRKREDEIERNKITSMSQASFKSSEFEERVRVGKKETLRKEEDLHLKQKGE